eukprot:gene9499-biopygen8045
MGRLGTARRGCAGWMPGWGDVLVRRDHVGVEEDLPLQRGDRRDARARGWDWEYPRDSARGTRNIRDSGYGDSISCLTNIPRLWERGARTTLASFVGSQPVRARDSSELVSSENAISNSGSVLARMPWKLRIGYESRRICKSGTNRLQDRHKRNLIENRKDDDDGNNGNNIGSNNKNDDDNGDDTDEDDNHDNLVRVTALAGRTRTKPFSSFHGPNSLEIRWGGIPSS